MKTATKTISVYTGQVPKVFYFALLLPPLITYLEYSLQISPLPALVLKYATALAFYLFCIDIINKQQLVIDKESVELSLNTFFFKVQKNIALNDIQSIKEHPLIPKLKVISHGRKQTYLFEFFKNSDDLFATLKSKRPDLF